MSRHWSSVLPLVAGLGVSAPALALEFSGLLDLRATATNTARSWTEEGSGKTRYDRSGAALRLGQALLRAEGDVGEAVRATLVLNAYDDRSQLIDVSEAFLHWRPLPAGPWRSRVRLGAFFPASSLEIDYDDIGWTPTRTLSSSAINSWIGEEIRPVGVEYDLLHKGLGALEGHRFGLSAALFGGSDPAGTLLAWRGWSVGDRITGLSEPLRLPDLPVLRPGAELAQQDRNLRIGRELDDRLGYYAAARYAYREVLELAALRYDSRGDPLRLREGQYSWDTRFNHFSLRWQPDAGWEVLSQGMRGQTLMGPSAVQLEFRSVYLLVSRSLGAGRLSLRLDWFSTQAKDVLPADPNDERGRAIALAYRHPLGTSLSLVTEFLQVRSRRDARLLIAEAERQRERSLTAALQWRL